MDFDAFGTAVAEPPTSTEPSIGWKWDTGPAGLSSSNTDVHSAVTYPTPLSFTDAMGMVGRRPHDAVQPTTGGPLLTQIVKAQANPQDGPPWLERVLRRMAASADAKATDDLRTITKSADVAGRRFLRLVADLLPAEPHISTSNRRDLIAEVETPTRWITLVVTPQFALVSAAQPGHAPAYLNLPNWTSNPAMTKRQIQRVLT